jgi:hypothetical protein
VFLIEAEYVLAMREVEWAWVVKLLDLIEHSPTFTRTWKAWHAKQAASPVPATQVTAAERLSIREGPVHFLGSDRQVPDAYAYSVLHGVGDGRCSRPNGVLPNALCVVGSRPALRL